MSPTLISTKLFVPALRPRRVLRNGLLEKLDEGLELGRRLTLISAPAGFGKTMLVVEWLEHLKIMPGAPQRFGWLSLDEPDSDPQRFFTYLIAAIQCIEPEIGQDVQEMLVSPGPPNPEALLANLINTLAAIPDRFILVLDDYHLLLAEPVHQTINFLVEHAPPQMHLVIASRADPPLNLPRLRARGQLTEIREADLRFSLDEAEDFLNQVLGLALSEAEVNALEGRTEGWIAGLQLAGLAIKSMDSSTTSNAGPPTSKATFIQSFSGSNRYILDYLLEEVLNRQPLSIQEFLLQTAILERMCGPLCEAVTGKPAGQETLESLESDHLFILPLDSERHWFRYHHLFRDLLQHRARQILGERLYSLHHQASKWFGEQGLTSEAISHAIHAGELEDAIRLVEDHAVQSLARGEIYALKGWLEALPEDVRLASPWLRIFEAWVSLLTGQMEAIEAWLPQAQEWRTIECDPQYSPEECKQMRGHSAAIRAYASTINGDIAGAVKAGQKALELLPPADLVVRSFVAFTLGGAYLFTDELENAVRAFEEASTMGKSGGNIHIVLPAQRALAYVQAEQGDLSQSAATSREAVRFVTDKRGRRSPVAAGALGTLGNVYYEWNELEEAGRYLAEAIELGSRWGNPDSALSNYVRMARVQYALGDIEAGDQFLQIAERMLQKQQLTPATHSILTNQQVKNWIVRAKLAQVLDWVENHAPDIETQILYTNQRAYQSLARAMLALGELDSAEELLNRLCDWAKGKALKGRLIQVLVLQARLEQARGNTPQACAILEQALGLGESQGYRRTFLDEGRPLGELLKVIASHGLAQDYARQLLSMLIDETGESESSEQGVRLVGDVLIETPSQREIEVLRLIAEGLTNQQIAERLVISLGTVKAHSSNIYRKLGVRNRTQALARARELNLM